MTCTVCGARKARRPCPALKHDICSVCCGTRRQIEIQCPSDCRYLTTAQAHPASVVKRQQDDDRRAFLPAVRDLSHEQAEMLWPLLGFLRTYRGDGLVRTTDDDVAAAAAALAATLDTAARGLIYEQRPPSLPAQRLTADIKPLVAELARERGSAAERDLAAAFRAIARGAEDARKSLPGGTTAYLDLLRRMLVPSTEPGDGRRSSAQPAPPSAAGGSLLIRP